MSLRLSAGPSGECLAPGCCPRGWQHPGRQPAAASFTWDLLGLLRECGFANSFVRVYWSFELGHLGGPQTLLVAVR
jgi:hypothetical protein